MGYMRQLSLQQPLLMPAVLAAVLLWPAAAQAKDFRAYTADVVVYGGTSAGVAAAVQAARMGMDAILIEPSRRHLGGMSVAGLGNTDYGDKSAIGGLAREFYQRLYQHYHGGGRDNPGQWTFEPSAAARVFGAMVEEAGVRVFFRERLDLNAGVIRDGNRLTAIVMESGKTFKGPVFIDATYEGDLMALAGVTYTVGREGNGVYGETLNGVQTANAHCHNFKLPVDPYTVPGDPASGLLPNIQAEGPGEEGAGDHRVQAYNFRLCLTNAPENRWRWHEPEGYDPRQYELLLRYFDAGYNELPLHIARMPNSKSDANNNGAFSTDYIGMNYAYPEADYAERERITREHEMYVRGLMYTLAANPRVPEHIRATVNEWGRAKDEFVYSGFWPHQMYIREARRMVSAYVMTEHHCRGREVVPDPVALGAYTMDSHNVQRYVDADGCARNEGDIQVGGFAPYGISYRAIVPREEECSNLLVPVCLSASHIAYGSIRMEPVFMALGQAAATAAALALEAGCTVQAVDYAALRARLEADGQVLARGLEAAAMEGIVVDDTEAALTADWVRSISESPFVGSWYLHDADARGGKEVRYEALLPSPGKYEVRLFYTAHPNRATNALVRITYAFGSVERRANQRLAPPLGGAAVSLGVLYFSARHPAVVTLSDDGADGYVVADAVQFLAVSGE